MLKKSIKWFRSSLTARITLITALILVAACGVTYGFIAWATPISYVSIMSSELEGQSKKLVEELEKTTLEKSGPVVDRFIVKTGAQVQVMDPDGNLVELPLSAVDVQAQEGSGDAAISYVTAGSVETDDADQDGPREDSVLEMEAAGSVETVQAEDVSVTVTQDALLQDEGSATAISRVTVTNNAISHSFSFKDSDIVYTVTVLSSVTAVNQAVEALGQVLPYLALVILWISMLGSVIYSRYITRPILRLNSISQKMAGLDFTWKCQESRADEIGMLGRNLNELSDRLSAALEELQTANAALRQDIDRERELERQRMAFFSAASHELKTPITILKGQLSGMLAGVDVYRDRDRYLARSLAVTNRMESLVQEILAVSRMEKSDFALKREPVNLSGLVASLAEQVSELARQKGQTLEVEAAPGAVVSGDRTLLARALENLLSNAVFHSPEGARVTVCLARGEDGPALTVENSGAQIPKEALPRLFEAFYRVDASRNRATGGSGLGLYLVKMILDRHGADCVIENMPESVKVTVSFPQTE